MSDDSQVDVEELQARVREARKAYAEAEAACRATEGMTAGKVRSLLVAKWAAWDRMKAAEGACLRALLGVRDVATEKARAVAEAVEALCDKRR